MMRIVKLKRAKRWLRTTNEQYKGKTDSFRVQSFGSCEKSRLRMYGLRIQQAVFVVTSFEYCSYEHGEMQHS